MREAFAPDGLAVAFREAAGHAVRWTLRFGAEARVLEGRVPPVRKWRGGEPVLVLRPGAGEGVHVLAEMEVRLVHRDGVYFLARRRWYEEEDLDLTRLGPEAPQMCLEELE